MISKLEKRIFNTLSPRTSFKIFINKYWRAAQENPERIKEAIIAVPPRPPRNPVAPSSRTLAADSRRRKTDKSACSNRERSTAGQQLVKKLWKEPATVKRERSIRRGAKRAEADLLCQPERADLDLSDRVVFRARPRLGASLQEASRENFLRGPLLSPFRASSRSSWPSADRNGGS